MAFAADPAASTFVEQVFADIEADRLELPGFPEAVLRIQRTLQSPDASVDDIVKLLSSEPALAAQALRIANSVAFRRRDCDITDLKSAVNRIGFNLVRTIAVAFAIQQLRLRETFSAAGRAEIASIWRASLNTASICYVLARHCTGVSADQALLAGLLHVLGRLYLIMRAEETGGAADTAQLEAAAAWQATIGKAILAGWGLSEALQHAVEHQDDLEHDAEEVSLTHVLIAAKHLGEEGESGPAECPVLDRLTAVRNVNPVDVLVQRADEVRELRASLGA